MHVKLAAPLFILRHACETDLMGVLEQIAALGFDGVEFLGMGFFHNDPQKVRAKLDALGLQGMGNHVDYRFFDADLTAVIDAHKAVSCEFLTVSGVPAECMPGNGKYAEAVEKITAWGRACKAAGMQLLYHNHAVELRTRIGTQYLYEAIIDAIPEDALALEPDLGWMAIGGADTAYFLTKYRDRSPVLHFKDYFATDASLLENVSGLEGKRGGADCGYFEFRPTGYGIMNYPALLQRCMACQPKWIVIDHDLAYERDTYDDLRISLEYTKNLLKHFA
jgi:sugar phosphate isomerase/epimerase